MDDLDGSSAAGESASYTGRSRQAEPGIRRELLQDVGTDDAVGTLFYPDADKRDTERELPALVVLGGSEGGLDEAGARSLAAEGYAALSLAYFGAGKLPRNLVEIPLEYFERATAWLKSRPRVNPDRVAVMGFSRGGELALLLASTFPQTFRAAVSYVGSGLLWPAVSFSGRAFSTWGLPQAAWTRRGRPLPYLPYAQLTPWEAVEMWRFLSGKGGFRPRPLFERSLALWRWNPLLFEAASIEVERIKGAVMLVSGGEDGLWPSGALSEAAARRLRRKSHPHEVRHLRYERAGHAITLPGAGPSAAEWELLPPGGCRKENERALEEAFGELLGFLKRNL